MLRMNVRWRQTPQVSKGVTHQLEALTVLYDGEVTLNEALELSIEVEGPSLPIATN